MRTLKPEKSNLRAAMSHRQVRADLVLLLVGVIWGATFVIVKDAVASYPVFAFLAIRFALASAIMLPLLRWPQLTRRLVSSSPNNTVTRPVNPLTAGVLLGLLLFASYAFQTYGLQYTTPAKAAFITGFNVVIVPLLAALLWRRLPRLLVLLGVLLAASGLALLSLNADLSVNRGDLLVLSCAVCVALHILATGVFAPRADPMRLTAVQLLTVAVLGGLFALLWERPLAFPSGSVWFAAVFTGLLASSFAQGVKTVALRFTSVTHAALILLMEQVTAALFSYGLGREALTARAWLGCGLILAGMLAAELSQPLGQRLRRR